jgi:hypothetical protein
MDVWRTNCPRLSIWEDAVGAGLVQIRASSVELTRRGESALRGDGLTEAVRSRA